MKQFLSILFILSISMNVVAATKKISGKITDLEVTYNGEQYIWFKVNGLSPSNCNGEKIKAMPPLVASYVLTMHAQDKNVWVAIHNS